MRKNFVVLFLICFCNSIMAQPAIDSLSNKKVEEKQIVGIISQDSLKYFEKVEIEAEFPGGIQAWRRFLEKNLNANVPAINGAPAGTYHVVVRFIVDKDGTLSDFKKETNYGYGMEEEVLRVFNKSPKWIPASDKGRNVKAYRQQPITFLVVENKKKKRKNRD